jgi:hypothetical protein
MERNGGHGSCAEALTRAPSEPSPKGRGRVIDYERDGKADQFAEWLFSNQKGIGISASAGSGAQLSTRSFTTVPITTIDGEAKASAST